MARWAKIENGNVVQSIITDYDPNGTIQGTWIDATGTGAGPGWTWDGTNFAPPAAPPTEYRKTLSGLEWVQTFTPAEWRSLKNLSQQATTPGELLDQLLDAIKLTNSVDLESPVMVQFYNYIVNQGWVTQARANELQQGIET